MNKVILAGRITKALELRYTQKGTAVCEFTLAIRKAHKQEDGQNTDFIRCKVWGTAAENLVKYMDKGSQIGVAGKIQSRTYEGKDGKKQYITEVVVEEVEYLESSKKNEDMDEFTPLEDDDEMPF